MENENLKKQLTIPNVLTFLRFLTIPYFVFLVVKEQNMRYAFVCFVLIWLTDILDGYIARNFHQISDLGKVMDPFVDKLFQLSTALSFLYIERLPLWVLVTFVLKESMMVIGGLLLWKKKTVVSSQWYGKITTGLYIVAFSFLFFMEKDMFFFRHLLFLPPTLLSYYALISYTLFYQEPLKTLKPMKEITPPTAKSIFSSLKDLKRKKR